MLESQIKWSWGTPHPPPMCTIIFYDVLNRLGATEVDPDGENHQKSSKIHENPRKSSKSKPNPDFRSKITKFRVRVPADSPESARRHPTGLLCLDNFIIMFFLRKT